MENPAETRSFPPLISKICGSFSGEKMKINIDELTYEEIHEVIERLRNMKIESKLQRMGGLVVLQTEAGPVQLSADEAVDVLGIPSIG